MNLACLKYFNPLVVSEYNFCKSVIIAAVSNQSFLKRPV